ncbi:uncharacterized protein PgNI_07635, partial [Pyricularia grisea]|uniref:Uncharacterized protein n=1 Tax=Pyricularia grisea TaxID=148305 RepID=A0A6P8B285_PYRGI
MPSGAEFVHYSRAREIGFTNGRKKKRDGISSETNQPDNEGPSRSSR